MIDSGFLFLWFVHFSWWIHLGCVAFKAMPQTLYFRKWEKPCKIPRQEIWRQLPSQKVWCLFSAQGLKCSRSSSVLWHAGLANLLKQVKRWTSFPKNGYEAIDFDRRILGTFQVRGRCPFWKKTETSAAWAGSKSPIRHGWDVISGVPNRTEGELFLFKSSPGGLQLDFSPIKSSFCKKTVGISCGFLQILPMLVASAGVF